MANRNLFTLTVISVLIIACNTTGFSEEFALGETDKLSFAFPNYPLENGVASTATVKSLSKTNSIITLDTNHGATYPHVVKLTRDNNFSADVNFYPLDAHVDPATFQKMPMKVYFSNRNGDKAEQDLEFKETPEYKVCEVDGKGFVTSFEKSRKALQKTYIGKEHIATLYNSPTSLITARKGFWGYPKMITITEPKVNGGHRTLTFDNKGFSSTDILACNDDEKVAGWSAKALDSFQRSCVLSHNSSSDSKNNGKEVTVLLQDGVTVMLSIVKKLKWSSVAAKIVVPPNRAYRSSTSMCKDLKFDSNDRRLPRELKADRMPSGKNPTATLASAIVTPTIPISATVRDVPAIARASVQTGANTDLGGLNAGQDGLNAGQDGLNAGQDGLNAGQDGLNAGQDGLNAGQDGLNAGQDGLNAGQDGLNAGQDGLNAGQDDLNAGQDDLNAGQDGLNAGQDGLNAGQDGLNAGQDGLNAGQDGLNAGQDGLNAGQKAQNDLHDE